MQQEVLKNGNSMSWAKIKRLPIASEQELSDAVDYGVESGFLTWSQYNIYNVKKRFNLPEESLYGVTSEEFKELWLFEKYNESEFISRALQEKTRR